ncbi:class F sortase [Streptomyces uncialis]|uniref:Sortase n=1 Tax=Streptomyces uncialis TaxID=1048205 RepID=A0A1Q4V054_9ACTN|nr:class F sortase [Streptomyces uncialis]OKH91191.1 sortase [Streptomyces uncialis]
MTGPRTSGSGRLAIGAAWAVLLLGLWLWGRELTSVPGGTTAPTTGDVAAVGRPLGDGPPAPFRPLAPSAPTRVDIPAIGVQAPVVRRGLDRAGAVAPPPFDQPGIVGWYGGGTRPGAPGAALLVGHTDTDTRPAVFHRIGALRPGDTIRVVRTDATVAEFTVEDVETVDRHRFDAARVYGPHERGRAELRLLTCAGTFDRASGTYSANTVVSAYLTGART